MANLQDFADALAEVTGGKRIKHSYVVAGGEAHFFTNTKDYHAFMQEKRDATHRQSKSGRARSSRGAPGPARWGWWPLEWTSRSTLLNLLAKGELPSAEEVTTEVVSAHPLGGVATARNHDETVIPLIVWAASMLVPPKVKAAIAIGIAAVTSALLTKQGIERGVRVIDEGIREFEKGREWFDSGGVPPPDRSPEEQWNLKKESPGRLLDAIGI